MTKILTIKLLLFLIFFIGSLDAKKIDYNEIQIIKKACPFEYCMYDDRWSVKKDTLLRKNNNINSTIVATVKEKEKIEALTGEIHIKPFKVTIVKNVFDYKKGEIIWLLDYVGEGIFNAWRNNRLTTVEFPFSPYQKMECQHLRYKNDCWFKIKGTYKMEWWIKFKTKDGIVGWSNKTDNFKQFYKSYN